MPDKKLLLGYERKWVALTHDRSKIIEAAESLKELVVKIKKIKTLDLEKIVITYVLPMDSYYSPLCNH